MASHAEARKWATDGFKSIFGREPTLLEVQFVQAVAWLESQYGQGWKGAGVGSWNMGAVQAGHAPCNPATSFEYTDTHPNPDGTSTPYTICFRKYPGPTEGMADVARILYKQMGITPTSIRAVSTQMYEKHYYEGFGATKEARINNHIKALTAGLTKITTALGELMPPSGEEDSPTATPKAPPGPGFSRAEWLLRLAHAMQVDAGDNRYASFGNKAKIEIKSYQISRGLVGDGVVGPKTLSKLIADTE